MASTVISLVPVPLPVAPDTVSSADAVTSAPSISTSLSSGGVRSKVTSKLFRSNGAELRLSSVTDGSGLRLITRTPVASSKVQEVTRPVGLAAPSATPNRVSN